MSLNQETEFHRQGTQLTLDLLTRFLHQSEPQNSIIFSPFSIRNCLALAFTGANNATAQEIADLMKYASNDKDEVAKIFHNILQTYSKGDLVKIANKVYLQNGHQLRKQYATTLADCYQAETENVNFAESQNAAQNINKWVEQKTHGKITELVSEDSLNESTRLVLLNAIHFKGDWQKKFHPEATVNGDFWFSDNEKVSLPFMKQKSNFLYGYFEDLNCTALEMSYKDSDLSMFILLPNERNGLESMLEQLNVNFDLKQLYARMNPEEVNVNFPKFKVEFSLELSDTFKQVIFYVIYVKSILRLKQLFR